MSAKTSNKAQGQTFINRKDPLPDLSFQDIKVVFANSPSINPATTVVMSIPYYYDLLSPQGIRDWNAQRASSIEQENVTTIRKDSFTKPVSFKTVIQPADEFNSIDQKVNEIKQYATIIEQDLDDLGIPQLTEQPHVEPLFQEYTHHTKRVRIYDLDTDDQSENAEGKSALASSQTKQFSKPKISSTILDSTERAREKVKIAETKLVKSGFSQRKKSDDKKNRPIANEERGKYNWGRINQLMQEDSF
ncbi:hypothetical protein M9Y10_022917 [Tritrichomonas musculus]|uniref:Uncharacterized protein n=1 Tax=Tritrichomonas musculus TaxID=1915356 RepID=A0ABR2KUJ2_9EUKA